MADVSYRLNYAAFGEEVMRSGFMLAEVRSRAERMLAAAEADAPHDTGQYAASFSVESKRDGGTDGKRAEASLVNSDPDALAIEFGHVAHNGTFVDGHHTMLRAIDAAR